MRLRGIFTAAACWLALAATCCAQAITGTYIGTATSTADATSYDFGDFTIPANGLVVVAAAGLSGGSSETLASATVGGNAAVVHITQATGHERMTTGIASCVAVAGSRNVTVVFSHTKIAASVAVYLLEGYDSQTPVDTDRGHHNQAAASTGDTATLDFPTDGYAIYCAFKHDNSEMTWTTATEDVDATQDATVLVRFSTAHLTSSGAGVTASYASLGGSRNAYTAAVWAPATGGGSTFKPRAIIVGQLLPPILPRAVDWRSAVVCEVTEPVHLAIAP